MLSLEPLDLSNYVRRGVSLGERDADHAAAPGFDGVAPDDPVRRPVGTLDEHVGLKPLDDALRIVLVEQHDGCHAGERRQNLGTLALRRNRPRGTLDGGDRSIRIYADDQRITLVAGGSPCS